MNSEPIKPPPHQSIPADDKIEEADLLKFQLLTAYTGMRKMELDLIEKDAEILRLKQELSQLQYERAQDEVRKCQAWLVENYNIDSKDAINYADGTIKRASNHDGPSKSQIQEAEEKIKEVEERLKAQIKEEEQR